MIFGASPVSLRVHFTRVSDTPRLVFPPSIEGLFNGLGDKATPELHAKLRARGLDVSRLPPAMPIEEWTTHLEFIREYLYPGMEREDAHRLMGRCFIDGWKKGLIGSAMAQLLKLVGPARCLPKLTRTFRTSNNYSSAQTELLSPNSARVIVSDVNGMPFMWKGTLEAGLELMAQGEVQLEPSTPPAASFLITWK